MNNSSRYTVLLYPLLSKKPGAVFTWQKLRAEYPQLHWRQLTANWLFYLRAIAGGDRVSNEKTLLLENKRVTRLIKSRDLSLPRRTNNIFTQSYLQLARKDRTLFIDIAWKTVACS